MSEININSRKREKKYDKLFNNLLGIGIREQFLFLRVDGIFSFDITTKFGEKYSKKILSQKEFDFFKWSRLRTEWVKIKWTTIM